MTAHAELGVLRGNPFGKSPLEDHLANGHFRATRRLLCAWSDKDTLLAELGSDGGQNYPHNTDYGARAVAANVVGLGQTSAGTAENTIAYEKALITVFYTTECPVVKGAYFISESFRPAGEMQSINATSANLRWGNAGGAKVLDNQGFRLPRGVYSLTFHNIFAVPSYSAAYMNYCNASPVTTYTLGLSFAAQTLLHPGPVLSITFPLGGTSRYSLTYEWIFNPQGWNTRFNPATSTYQAIYVGGGSQVIFHPTCDFNAFKP